MAVTTACVVVNFNGHRDTLRAVESLEAQSTPPDLIIVVDNGSAPQEARLLAEKLSERVVLLRNPVNLGFAGGCNEGIRYAQAHKCARVLILNNDIWAEPDAVASLSRALDSGADSAACPLIVRMDDPNVVWAAGGELNLQTGRFGHRLKGAHRRAAQRSRRVNFASGCALMVNTEVFREIGLLPERWFLYFEDTEFCAQLARAGRTIAYVPGAVVQHLGQASTSRSDANYYFFWRNYLLFVLEWMRGPAKVLALTRILATMAAIAGYNVMVGRPRRARMIVAAARDGLGRRWGSVGVSAWLG